MLVCVFLFIYFYFEQPLPLPPVPPLPSAPLSQHATAAALAAWAAFQKNKKVMKKKRAAAAAAVAAFESAAPFNAALGLLALAALDAALACWTAASAAAAAEVVSDLVAAAAAAAAEARREAAAIGHARTAAAATHARAKALAAQLEGLGGGGAPNFDKLLVAKTELLEAADEADEAKVALNKAKRRDEAQEWQAAMLRQQQAQRAVEAECAALAALAAGPFPELRARPEFQRAAVDPDVGAVAVLGRSLDMYEAVPWPREAAPRAASQHGVGLYRFCGALVVLKQVPRGDASAVRRLTREVLALRELADHPNVAPVDAVFFDGAATLVLQTPFFPRGTLAHYLEDPAVAPPRLAAPHGGVVDRAAERSRLLLVPALRQLLSALVAVHARGMVHGDVKLANVWVAGDGTVVLGDFGLAHLAADAPLRAASAMATTRVGAGTPLYMAPEVESGAGAATAAADVYGFAVCALLALAPGLPLPPLLPPLPQGRALGVPEAWRLADPEAAAALAPCLALDPAARPPAPALLALPLFALDAAAAAALAARERAAASRQRACVACGGGFDRGEGCACAQGHFACAACLARWVAADAQHGPSGAVGVRCLEHGCAAPELSYHELAGVLPAAALEPLRRREEAAWKAAAAKPWSTAGVALAGGGTKHEIHAAALHSGADTREQDEFNFACGQLLRLSGHRTPVRQVDVYDNPALDAAYAAANAALPAASRELWVFHGTPHVDAVMASGFKVGGRDAGVAVANGTVHGHGVYTATGPDTPMTYARHGNTNAVILAKAIEGTRGAQGSSDCWAPRGDWLVFKSGAQLLPKYVVYW